MRYWAVTVKYLPAILLILLGLVNPSDRFDAIGAFIMVCSVIMVIVLHCVHPRNNLRFNLFFLVLILIIFATTSWHNSSLVQNFLKKEPVVETYRTDMDDYLRTFYLMKRGQLYYPAHKKAVVENAFKTVMSSNLWSWRFPTLFLLWQLIPTQTGIGILTLFLFCALVSLSSSYFFIFKMLPDHKKYLAILAPYLLYPYFHFGVRDATLLQAEWWGVFFIIIALTAWVYQKKWLSVFWFTAAVLTREIFIIPLVLTLLGYLLLRKKEWVYFTIPLTFFLIVLYVHSQFVKQFADTSTDFLTPRLHSFGIAILRVTLAFGSWEYYFYRFRIFIIFYILALWGLFKKSENVLLLGPFFILPLTFLFIGTSIYNDYWGVMYMPVILLTVPLILI
jgi:hypothetical protein